MNQRRTDMNRLDYETDNRDESETWLVSTVTLEVDPTDLYRNMIENCFDVDDKTVDYSPLRDMIDYLNEILTRREQDSGEQT